MLPKVEFRRSILMLGAAAGRVAAHTMTKTAYKAAVVGTQFGTTLGIRVPAIGDKFGGSGLAASLVAAVRVSLVRQ